MGTTVVGPVFAADAKIEAEVRTLFTAGAWERALGVLEQAPNVQTDLALKELQGMAYLYTASRLDSMGNSEKAATVMKQVVSQGGKAQFYVGKARDKKKEVHLVEATPGELTVTGTSVEFPPGRFRSFP